MGDLQQVVEGLHHIPIGAVGVLQVQSAVLLEVKPLVFDFATDAPSLVGHGQDVGCGEGEVGDPGEGDDPVVLVLLT